MTASSLCLFFFFQAEDGIRDLTVTGVQTCALPISDYYQPWSCDSRSLLICPYGSPPTLLDLDNRRARELRVKKGSLLTALCSRTRPLAFLAPWEWARSEEHTAELQSQSNIVCRVLLDT